MNIQLGLINDITLNNKLFAFLDSTDHFQFDFNSDGNFCLYENDCFQTPGLSTNCVTDEANTTLSYNKLS